MIEKNIPQPSLEALIAENESLKKEVQRLLEENEQLRNLAEIPPPVTGEVLLSDAHENTEYLAALTVSAQLSRTSPVADKIALFKSLFCGREDVYARQWKGKDSKPGYSPACKNEWKKGLCGKPQVKCALCTHAQYLPFDDNAVEKNLSGACVIGVYPLKPDNSCSFLAIDFDGEAWRTDAQSVTLICAEQKIPHTVEISRSVNGAHLWFFFDSPLKAELARNFGSQVLSQAMQRNSRLNFSSYDRMFPNQDSMPRGGFGNLIALPLQKEARKRGCTEFVDSSFESYPDQWAFLSQLEKLSQAQLEQYLSLWQSPPLGDLLADNLSPTGESKKPWQHKEITVTAQDMPETARCVLADRLYISTAGFSDSMLNKVKRMAAFKNPEFYLAQAMRMPVWNKPRIISCSEHLGDFLALPGGCLEAFRELAHTYKFRVQVEDERSSGKQIEVSFTGVLREEQQAAFSSLSRHENGVLSAATAFGKTVIAASLIGEKKVSTLILVHRKQLLLQWQERLAEFLDIKETLPSTEKKHPHPLAAMVRAGIGGTVLSMWHSCNL